MEKIKRFIEDFGRKPKASDYFFWDATVKTAPVPIEEKDWAAYTGAMLDLINKVMQEVGGQCGCPKCSPSAKPEPHLWVVPSNDLIH